jgi:hypothetical protein
MSTEKNNDEVVNRKSRQEALDAKQNEIVENLDKVSLKEAKESKEEANAIGDDHE